MVIIRFSQYLALLLTAVFTNWRFTLQLGHSQAEQKGAFIEENLRRVLQEQERLRAEKEKLSGGHADSSETIAAREREIAALEAEIQASGDKRTQMELVIQNKQREKEEKRAAENFL